MILDQLYQSTMYVELKVPTLGSATYLIYIYEVIKLYASCGITTEASLLWLE